MLQAQESINNHLRGQRVVALSSRCALGLTLGLTLQLKASHPRSTAPAERLTASITAWPCALAAGVMLYGDAVIPRTAGIVPGAYVMLGNFAAHTRSQSQASCQVLPTACFQ